MAEPTPSSAPLKIADLPLAARTAPERIWLDLGVEEAEQVNFAELGEVTWSPNNATGHGIAYVRADAQAVAAQAPANGDGFMEAVNELDGLYPATEDSSAGDQAEPDAWHQAVLDACMATEACYVAGDAKASLDNLIDWHIDNERRDPAEVQAVGKPANPHPVNTSRHEAWEKGFAGREMKMCAAGSAYARAHLDGAAARTAMAAPQAEVQAEPVAPPTDVVYRWHALDYSGYCYGSNPPHDLPTRCNLTALYRQPDSFRAALREISATGNLTATGQQFARHLQQIARDALAATPVAAELTAQAPVGFVYRNSVTGEFELREYAGDNHPMGAHVDIYTAPQAQPADALDAARYRLLRRGQHWSVIDGIGDDLRADALDASIDASIAAAQEGGNAAKEA